MAEAYIKSKKLLGIVNAKLKKPPIVKIADELIHITNSLGRIAEESLELLQEEENERKNRSNNS
jgi:hypothetical protein